jgi:hypothetical protein
MPSVEFSVNLNDPAFADFLAEITNTTGEHVQSSPRPNNFKEAHRRKNEQDIGTINAPFLVRELYQLKLGKVPQNVPQGTLATEVFLEQPLIFWVEYVLFLKDDLPQEKVERAIKLVDEYDPQISSDLSAWIAEQIKDGWLNESEIALLADVHIQKSGAYSELNITQREALFRLYGLMPPRIETRIDVLPETSFPDWAQKRYATLDLVGTEAIRRNQPQVGREVAEVKAGTPPGSTAQSEIRKLLDDITRNILPVECRGDFRRQERRLLSVLEWPEFKIEWYTISIKVGCAVIKFDVPRLLIRLAHLVIFIYYHVPQKFDEAIITIVKNCAIRSALSGAVIGIVVGNPAAALAAFQSFFVDCLRQDAFACVNPGIFLVKEVGAWQ